MARGGINKAIVQKAREVLLARGENPSIDAVRVELGNTGSKTTIHRYLKEIDAVYPRSESTIEPLSDELTAMIAALLARLREEGAAATVQAQNEFNRHKAVLQGELAELQVQLDGLGTRFSSQRLALEGQTEELQTTQSSLQSELTRNARLAQNCSDLEVRIVEKDQVIRSLEEKHLHARDALEHYRNAVKEQRDQEQQRHEGQLQQVQLELRQAQQSLMVKQDELTRLNRDNERLLGESRQQAKALRVQDEKVQGLTADIGALQIAGARAEGANEQLQAQLAALKDDSRSLSRSLLEANAQASEANRLLAASQEEHKALHDQIQAMQATA